MNKLFNKIAAGVVGLAMAIGVGVAIENAQKDVTFAKAGQSTITFTPGTDTDATTVTKGGVTVTMTTMNNASYYQIYKSQTGTFTCSTGSIKQINFTCTASGTSKYGPGSFGAGAPTGYSYSGTSGTWSGSSQSVSFTATDNQVRISALTVIYDNGQTNKLDAPNLVFNRSNNTITWEAVANATEYQLKLDSGSYAAATSGYSVASVSLNDAHTVYVKASATGYTTSDEATLTFHRYATKGTSDNPYTVEDARRAIDDNDGLTNVYATGVVSAIPTAYDSQYSNITFNFIDEGGTDFLQAFRCSGTDAANVQVGDTVVVSGNLTKYGSTYEFAQGCTLVSLTHPVVETTYTVSFDSDGGTDPADQEVGEGLTFIFPSAGTNSGYLFTGWTCDAGTTFFQAGQTSPAVNDDVEYTAFWQTEGTSADPYSVADAMDAIDDNKGLVGAHVSGKISQVDSYNSTYKSIQYWISDDGTTTTQLEAYSGKGLNGADFTAVTDIEVGADVVICGTLKKYNTTYEFDKNNYQVSYTAPVVTTYTVTYSAPDKTSGDIPVDSTAYAANATVTVLGAGNLAKTGYVFAGWSDGTNTYVENQTFTITSDVTLTAQWSESTPEQPSNPPYSADFTSVETHSYTQNTEFELGGKGWVASVSQVNAGVFYLGCNSTHASKGVLNDNSTFASVVAALAANDSVYSESVSTAHAYALLFDHPYNGVKTVTFEWAGGNNAFQVYLFGDSGSGYTLLASENYATSGQAVSGSVSWTDSSTTTNFLRFAIVARPGTTSSTATSKTLRAGTFSIAAQVAPTYTISYDSNGGTGTMSDTTGTAPEVQACSFTAPAGKEFDRWNTSSDGTGIDYSVGDVASANVTLYAIWKNVSEKLVIDATYLGITEEVTEQTSYEATDGIHYEVSPSSGNKFKPQNSSGNNRFSEEPAILIGKSGAYIINTDAYDKAIDNIKVFSNTGASTSVVVAVGFGTTSAVTDSLTGGTTLDTNNKVYTYNPANANVDYYYFKLQITSAHNAQVQIQITFKDTTSYTAADFATEFLATLSTGSSHVCVADGSTNLSSLKAAWKTLAGKWGDVSDPTSITNAVASESGNDYQKTKALYIYIAEKYNTQLQDSELTDYNFMGLTGLNPRSSARVSIFDTNTESGGPTLAIIIASILSLTVVGGYFVIRKRKFTK